MNLNASEFPGCLESLLLTSLNLRGARPNLLVSCSLEEVPEVIDELSKWCLTPLNLLSLPATLDLPTIFEGTLLLTRIEALSLDQQITLFDWMTMAQCRMQVVSIATTRIDGLVKEGRFLEALFYRLNVVQLEARRHRGIQGT